MQLPNTQILVESIYQSDIQKAIETLNDGGIILYPTDSIWGLGCSPFDIGAIERISILKERPPEKSLVLLVSSLDMLGEYVSVIHPKEDKLVAFSNTPVTIIYKIKNNPFAEGVVAMDGTVGIRVVKNGFAHELVEKFQKPLVSTSPNKSGEDTPLYYKDIAQDIIAGADYVVNPSLHYQMTNKPSKLAKLNKKGKEFDFLR